MIPTEENNEDGLRYVKGKSLDNINNTTMNSVILAYTDGRVPNINMIVNGKRQRSK